MSLCVKAVKHKKLQGGKLPLQFSCLKIWCWDLKGVIIRCNRRNETQLLLLWLHGSN